MSHDAHRGDPPPSAATAAAATATRAATAAAALAAAVALAACGGGAGSAGSTTVTSKSAPSATAAVSTARVPLRGSSHTLSLPRGWHAQVWARLSAPRLEAWTPQHTLLVSQPTQGTVTELTPGRRPGARPRARTVISGLPNAQGLAFDRVGGREVLYVIGSNQLDRYTWSRAGRPGVRTVLVRNLPDTKPAGDDVHRLKNVVVGSDHTIYLDIGSSSNATAPAPVPKGALPRAAVIAYRPDGTRKRIWATGIRNGDGLAFAPDGTLWTAVNERDQIAYPFHRAYGSTANAYGKVIPGYVGNHPPDEVARLTAGRNLGWPYCDPDPDVHPGRAGTALRYGNMRFTADAQTNPGGRRLNCGKLAPLQRGLPAHSAPIGFHFLQGSKLPARWTHGAVVAGHGSWDRQPPRAPVVYWMPWQAKARTLGPAMVLVGGFQNADGTRWGRLADAVPGPDGSLYVSDNQSGEIDRITP